MASIIGLGVAADLAGRRIGDENSRVAALRDRLEKGLLEAIRRAVEDRIPPSGAFGIHLSGGLDSAAIAGLTASRRPRAFAWQSATPEDEEGDRLDFELIGALAARHSLEVRYCPATADDVFEALQRDPSHDEQ